MKKTQTPIVVDEEKIEIVSIGRINERVILLKCRGSYIKPRMDNQCSHTQNKKIRYNPPKGKYDE